MTSLLCHYIKQSERIITGCFRRAYPDEKFMPPDSLERLVCAEADKSLQEGMLRLVELMVRLKTLEKGVRKIGNEGYGAAAILSQFAKLGVSPIPVRKKFCVRSMPGVSVLLERIAHRNVQIWYK